MLVGLDGGAHLAQRLDDLVRVRADAERVQGPGLGVQLGGQADDAGLLALAGDHGVGVENVAVRVLRHAGHDADLAGLVEAVHHDALGPAQVALRDVVERGGELVDEQFVVRGDHGEPFVNRMIPEI